MDTDILIIGGGISGCALAYFLSKEGMQTLLVEKSGLNSAASGANSGSLHGQIPHDVFLEKGEEWARSFGPTLALMRKSLSMWKNIESTLDADLEVKLTGGLLIASSDSEMIEIQRKVSIEREFGINAEMLNKTDLRQYAPYVSERMIGAAFYPDEGKANPLLAGPAFAAKAVALGAKISRNVEVEQISVQKSQFHVQTNNGSITCRKIANCAGNDVARVSAMVGLTSPIAASPIQVNVTEPMAPMIHHLIYSASEKLTLKQTYHGSCIIGGGWSSRFDHQTGKLYVDHQSVVKNLQVAINMVPDLVGVQLVRTWPAAVNGTDDWRPILGEDDTVSGFFTNAFPWMGFTGGPISARLTADLILHGSSSISYDQLREC